MHLYELASQYETANTRGTVYFCFITKEVMIVPDTLYEYFIHVIIVKSKLHLCRTNIDVLFFHSESGNMIQVLFISYI